MPAIAVDFSEQPSRLSPLAQEGILIRPTDEWRDHAVCRKLDPGIFFRPETTDNALAACRYCTVQQECLTDAYMYGERGVRGGLTEEARRYRTIPDEIGPVKVIVEYALFDD